MNKPARHSQEPIESEGQEGKEEWVLGKGSYYLRALNAKMRMLCSTY
jgi:hypothetical protein